MQIKRTKFLQTLYDSAHDIGHKTNAPPFSEQSEKGGAYHVRPVGTHFYRVKVPKPPGSGKV